MWRSSVARFGARGDDAVIGSWERAASEVGKLRAGFVGGGAGS